MRQGRSGSVFLAGLAVALAMLTGTVRAQPDPGRFPALYDVTGVASDDVLNLRAAPDPGAAIVATLPADRRNAEVLEISDNGWALVGLGEGAGWGSLRYLTAQPPRPADAVPTPMRCFGTEPFWGLNFPGDGSAEYERLPEPERMMRVTLETEPVGRLGELAIGMSGDTAKATAFLRREACSDGMSDRPFGLSLRLLIATDGGTPVAHAGCCSLNGP
jgi:uncharacterized membrane protein